MNIVMIFNIARHELSRLFKSPLAWTILAVVQFLLAFCFFWLMSRFFEANTGVLKNLGVTVVVVAGLLQMASVLLLLVTPFITMHLFSEERQNGTMKLLLSSPISVTELVLGKYLAILGFLLILLVLVALMPISLMLGTELDLLQLGAGLLGLFLLMSSFAAIGLFVATLTDRTSTAAISTFGVLFVLAIINITSGSGVEKLQLILAYLSLLSHYRNLLDGFFNSADVVYYLLISGFFVILSIWRIDSERLP